MHNLTTPVTAAIQTWLQYAATALAMDTAGEVVYIEGLESDDGLYRPFYTVVPVGSALDPTHNSSSYLSITHAGISNNESYGRPTKYHTLNFVVQARTEAISTSDRDFAKAVIDWGLAEEGRMNFGLYNYAGLYRIMPESPVYFDRQSQTYISRVAMRFLLC